MAELIHVFTIRPRLVTGLDKHFRKGHMYVHVFVPVCAQEWNGELDMRRHGKWCKYSFRGNVHYTNSVKGAWRQRAKIRACSKHSWRLTLGIQRAALLKKLIGARL